MPTRTAKKLFVTTFVLLLGTAFTFEASADKKVDWSEYLEKPGSAPPPTGKGTASKQDKTSKSSKKVKSSKKARSSKKVKSSKKAKAKAAKGKSKRRVAARSSSPRK